MKKISLLLISILLLFINCNIKSVEKEDYIMDFKNIESDYDLSYFENYLAKYLNNFFQIEQHANYVIFINEQGKRIFKIDKQDYSISFYNDVTSDDNIIISASEILELLLPSLNTEENFLDKVFYDNILSYNNIIFKFDGVKKASNITITCNYSSIINLLHSNSFCINNNVFNLLQLEVVNNKLINKDGKTLMIFNDESFTIPNDVTIDDNINILLEDVIGEKNKSKYKYLNVIFVNNNSKIFIKNIDVVETNNANYNKPTFNNNNFSVNLNTNFNKLNGYIKYKLTIENNSNENYELNINKPSSNYFNYKIEYENGNIIKSNSKSNFYIILKYNKYVDNPNGFTEQNNIDIKLSPKNTIIDELINPETGVSTPILLMIVLLIVSLSIFLIITKINKAKLFTIIVFLLITIPVIIKSLARFDIVINSSITIPKEYVYSTDFTHVNIKPNSKLPTNVEIFDNKEEAMENWTQKPEVTKEEPFYIKYRLDENQNIKEAYLEFIITDEIAKNKDGVIPGTYSFRGGGATYEIDQNGKEIYNNDSIYYEDNIKILKEAFGYDVEPSRFFIYADDIVVNLNNFFLYIYKNGNIHIYEKYKYECNIIKNNAYCGYFSTTT